MQQDEFTIREVRLTDLEQLTILARDTFLTAFGPHNSAEDMDAYLASSLNEEQLRTELSNTESFFFFLVKEAEAIGYLKLNVGTAQNEALGPDALELERIYIASDYQGRGLGSQLMEFTLAEARRLGKKIVWLGVWDQNKAAMRLYEGYGFETFGSHDFMLGKDLQTDILMKLSLNT